MQQCRPVDVRLVRHAELDKPGAAVALHGPAFLGSAVPDLAAAGRIPSVPHGRIAAASLAQVVQVNDARCVSAEHGSSSSVRKRFFFFPFVWFSTSSPQKKVQYFQFLFLFQHVCCYIYRAGVFSRKTSSFISKTFDSRKTIDTVTDDFFFFFWISMTSSSSFRRGKFKKHHLETPCSGLFFPTINLSSV